jgi:two-component system LytT family sensor kinase
VAPDTHSHHAPPPISVHFVNNVLAAAASYVEDDPDQAREVLAELSAFLTYRLRPEVADVTLADELDHVRVYVRLQQARFPDRIEASLPGRGELPNVRVARAAVQDPVAGVLGRRLGERPGLARLAVHVAAGGAALEVEVTAPDDPAGERVTIPLLAEVPS